MTRLDPEVRGVESVDELLAMIEDPDTSRGARLKAKARVKELTGQGNREVRRSWAGG